MKVVAENEVTRIYPFIQADGEPGISSEYIKVYPGGAIRHVRPHRAVMSAENVRLLAKALEYAAGLAEAEREDEEERVNTLYSIPDSLPKNLSSFIPDSLENSPN